LAAAEGSVDEEGSRDVYYVLTSREELLRYFPKGAVGAEIGVAEGAYSAAILERAAPSELHLIDPWSHLEGGGGLLQAGDVLAAADQTRAGGGQFDPPPESSGGDMIYERVAARFKGDPRVRLHRQYSYKAAAGMADGSLDFVYLDGNHHYEFVLRDLRDFAAKLKPGGLLFGHDFFEDAFAREENYGVIDAVGAFVKRSEFCFMMLTWEPFSTFCLARRLDGFAGQFMHNIFESDVQMIEIPDAFAASYQDKAYERRNGTRKRIPSFMNSLHFQLS
jgi:SAM-dependent methyltransferase